MYIYIYIYVLKNSTKLQEGSRRVSEALGPPEALPRPSPELLQGFPRQPGVPQGYPRGIPEVSQRYPRGIPEVSQFGCSETTFSMKLYPKVSQRYPRGIPAGILVSLQRNNKKDTFSIIF